jgi:hypothetical protein
VLSSQYLRNGNQFTCLFDGFLLIYINIFTYKEQYMKYKYFYVRQQDKAQVSASTGNYYVKLILEDLETQERCVTYIDESMKNIQDWVPVLKTPKETGVIVKDLKIKMKNGLPKETKDGAKIVNADHVKIELTDSKVWIEECIQVVHQCKPNILEWQA